VAPIVPGREPKAVALDPNHVRLSWDNLTHPQILVRNADGEVISILDNGGLDLYTDSRHLDLDMSDGLRVLRHRVEVTAPADTGRREADAGCPAGAGK
jgi:homogentisate 1,2-dioxygenase